MTQEALVSIITPVYNAERYVDETIASVLKQTHSNWELLLIIDAKSSDSSFDICKKWSEKDARIQLVSASENLGVASNRNAGIRAAKGEFVAFLDSDDVWLPNKLERQIQFMQSRQIDFTCHDYSQMDSDSRSLSLVRACRPEITFTDLLKSNDIGCLTVMVRSSLIKQFEFNPQVPHEDFIMWLAILKRIPKVYGLQENLARYRVLPHSRSGNKKRAALDRWYLYRQVLGLNLWDSIYYFFSYAFKAVIQRAFPSL